MERKVCKKCGTDENVNFDGMCKKCYDNSIQVIEKSEAEDERLEDNEGKKAFFKSKKNIAIFVLAILLLFSIFGTSSSSKEKDLNSQIANLSSSLSEKEEQITNLQNTNKELKEEKQTLEEEKKKLEDEKQNLEGEKNSLEEEKKNLNTKIEELQKTSSINNNSQSQNSSVNTPNKVTTQATSQSTSQTTTKTTTSTTNTNSAVVYVTKTGEKYHRAGCSYLKNSKIEMSLSDAKNKGYTACSKCNP